MRRNSKSVWNRDQHHYVSGANKVLSTACDTYYRNHGVKSVADACSPRGFSVVEPPTIIHMEYTVPYSTRRRWIIIGNPKRYLHTPSPHSLIIICIPQDSLCRYSSACGYVDRQSNVTRKGLRPPTQRWRFSVAFIRCGRLRVWLPRDFGGERNLGATKSFLYYHVLPETPLLVETRRKTLLFV